MQHTMVFTEHKSRRYQIFFSLWVPLHSLLWKASAHPTVWEKHFEECGYWTIHLWCYSPRVLTRKLLSEVALTCNWKQLLLRRKSKVMEGREKKERKSCSKLSAMTGETWQQMKTNCHHHESMATWRALWFSLLRSLSRCPVIRCSEGLITFQAWPLEEGKSFLLCYSNGT